MHLIWTRTRDLPAYSTSTNYATTCPQDGTVQQQTLWQYYWSESSTTSTSNLTIRCESSYCDNASSIITGYFPEIHLNVTFSYTFGPPVGCLCHQNYTRIPFMTFLSLLDVAVPKYRWLVMNFLIIFYPRLPRTSYISSQDIFLIVLFAEACNFLLKIRNSTIHTYKSSRIIVFYFMFILWCLVISHIRRLSHFRSGQ
jgi:hypothetical protein